MSDWKPEPELRQALFDAVPGILKSQRVDGQFGTDPWTCRDQDMTFPLAAAWSFEDSPYYHDEKVLEAIVLGGDALIDAQDENGMWTFRKKDHSTWGQIYMPWTYSRWIRTYHIVREAMSQEAQDRWNKGLLLGFEGISATALERIHNIPTHHAMALYYASKVFERKDWESQATDFMAQVVAKQSEYGWWTENVGPVVAYNFVYSDSFGVYYHASGDPIVLKALERAARFHANYTYPDGSSVETVDERNAYSKGVHDGNPGFSHTALGRWYLSRKHKLIIDSGEPFDVDYATNILLYSGEGPTEGLGSGSGVKAYRMGEDALISHQSPWFVSISAYVCPMHENRFIQDRQNFLSVFHEKTGLIVGGGNTKLQPLWSTFTVGDTSLMVNTGDQSDPNFGPFEGLLHIPDDSTLGDSDEEPALSLQYGEEMCKVTTRPENDTTMTLIYEATSNSGMDVEGHITLIPHLGEPLSSSDGHIENLGEEAVEWSGSKGGWVEHAGWRLSLPEGSRLVWPAHPHNAYRKLGDATVEIARIAIALSFSKELSCYELKLEVK